MATANDAAENIDTHTHDIQADMGADTKGKGRCTCTEMHAHKRTPLTQTNTHRSARDLPSCGLPHQTPS